jgi:hypothetical protein
MSFRRFAGVGTVIAVVIWLLASVATGENPESCERAGGICLSFEVGLVVWGIYIGALWLFVLFVVRIVVALVRYVRWRMSEW